MLDWISANKEWILSGIGIAVIVLTINIIFRSRDKKHKQIKRVAQRYLDILDNKIPGYTGIPGLIQSGATQLSKNKDLIKVCEIIRQHGKPSPLPDYIRKHLSEKELLKFVKWYANRFGHDRRYSNEQEFVALVQRYNEDKKCK